MLGITPDQQAFILKATVITSLLVSSFVYYWLMQHRDRLQCIVASVNL